MTDSLISGERWQRRRAWQRIQPSLREVLTLEPPSRALQIARKFALCDDLPSVAGLVIGAILERVFDPGTVSL